MPSTYTPSLKLILQATGENTGTWGALTNSDLVSLLDIAIAGYQSISMTDADRTLTNGDGALPNEARYAFISMTGTLTAARNVIVPTASKLYYFRNSTTGGFALTLKTASGTGISVPNGSTMLLLCDGTNVVDSVTTFSTLRATGTISNTGTSLSGSAPANSLVVSTGGNVGIGTATPTFKLVAANNTTDGGWLYSSTAVSILGLGGYSGAADGAFSLRFDRGSGITTFNTGTRDTPVERIQIDASGNVGINVTPVSKLHLSGGASGVDTRITIGNAATALQIGIDSSNNAIFATNTANTLQFFINSTEVARINPTGNVLVGVTSQVYPATDRKTVEVNGTAQSLFGLAVGGTAAGYFLHDGTNLSVYQTRSGAMTFGTNNLERMRIDSSGNLGLGVVPSAWGSAERALEVGVRGSLASVSDGSFNLLANSYVNSSGQFIYRNTAFASRLEQLSGQFRFFTAASGTAGNAISFTQAMTLDASGNLLVGASTQVTSEMVLFKKANGTNHVERIWNSSTTGDNAFVVFTTETSPVDRGGITYNRVGGLVSYNTTSDYRSKDIIGPVQDLGATIDGLKVYEGMMKGATRSRPMLVAHEVQEYAPYAVSGVKDEVNEDGTPKYQQMDVSSLVPLLIAEIQSLRTRISALEERRLA